MRVLLVSHNYPPAHTAGTEVYTANLARGLRARGHEVVVFCAEKDVARPHLSLHVREHEGVRVLELVNNLHYASFAETWDLPAVDEVFARVLDEVRPDVVHLQHLLYLSVGVAERARAAGATVVMTLHDFWLQCARFGQRLAADGTLCDEVDVARCAACLASFRYANSALEQRLAGWIAGVKRATGVDLAGPARAAGDWWRARAAKEPAPADPAQLAELEAAVRAAAQACARSSSRASSASSRRAPSCATSWCAGACRPSAPRSSRPASTSRPSRAARAARRRPAHRLPRQPRAREGRARAARGLRRARARAARARAARGARPALARRGLRGAAGRARACVGHAALRSGLARRGAGAAARPRPARRAEPVVREPPARDPRGAGRAHAARRERSGRHGRARARRRERVPRAGRGRGGAARAARAPRRRARGARRALRRAAARADARRAHRRGARRLPRAARRAMKLLLAVHGYPPELVGGTELAAEGLARGLAAAGHDVTVVAASLAPRTPGAVRVERGEQDGVRVVRVTRPDLYHDHWQKSRSVRVNAVFRELLRELAPDVVHVLHWLRLSRELVAVAARAGVPSVVSLNDAWTSCPLGFRVDPRSGAVCEREYGGTACVPCAGSVPPRTPWVPLEAAFLEARPREQDLARELAWARVLLAPSRAHAARLARFTFGLTAERLRVVPPAAPAFSAPARVEPAAPPPLVVLALGALSPLKGSDLLLAAARDPASPAACASCWPGARSGRAGSRRSSAMRRAEAVRAYAPADLADASTRGRRRAPRTSSPASRAPEASGSCSTRRARSACPRCSRVTVRSSSAPARTRCSSSRATRALAGAWAELLDAPGRLAALRAAVAPPTRVGRARRAPHRVRGGGTPRAAARRRRARRRLVRRAHGALRRGELGPRALRDGRARAGARAVTRRLARGSRSMPSLPTSTIALLALLALAACGAPGDARAHDAAPLTAEAELPPDYRDAWRAWYDDAPEWGTWRERALADPHLAAFLVDNLLRVMVKFYDHAALTQAKDLPGYFERAQRELLYLRDASGPVLVELVRVGDGVVSVLAGDLLVRMDDARWTLATLALTEDAAPEVRRRALELCARLPHAHGDEPRVLARLEPLALADPEWHVRAQAVRALGARALAGSDLVVVRRVLSRALADDDRAVALEAARQLAASVDLGAVPALLNQLERRERAAEPELTVVRGLDEALARVTGVQGLHGARAWRAWWRENRP
ncbi:MAG: glycosyltransferase [Planctomycetes bacterium]|nr:glycosyltransferase [Planctomycetota bacterium]